MIAGLEGIVISVGADNVVLNVSGVFYRVYMPVTGLAQLSRPGEVSRVHTFLYVREDQLALYGTPDERGIRMFETLLAVSGIGPKVALSILGTMPVDALENAISSGNVDLLTRIPGIGRKTASRLVLELKGKLDLTASIGLNVSPSSTSEVVDALTGLGYSPAEISAALADMSKDVEHTTEEMVLHALKRLGR